jgi:hypothetical protein
MANTARGWLAAAVLMTAVSGTAAAAAPSDYVGRTPSSVPEDPARPRVLGTTEVRSTAATGSGAGTSGASEPIPITGGDVLGLTALGTAALVGGAVLLRRGRRAPG